MSGYGISLDIDALDPVEEPGVGSPEAKQVIKVKHVCDRMK
jgi:arginase family enzyme